MCDFRQQIIDLNNNNNIAELESIERENDDRIEKRAKFYDAEILNEEGEYKGNITE